MDRLWTPWRYQYVTKEKSGAGCIFCQIASESKDKDNYVLFRGEYCFALLNRYPYTSGHLMLAPYQHVGGLSEAGEPALEEMIRLAARAEQSLGLRYHPQGMNIGMNLGESAGAGIAGHIHLHVLPRWTGDSNFMTTTSETRVMPESLDTSYEKLTGLPIA
jgi:ATP adenylyltransferase